MKAKTIKIWYWITTILFAGFMLFSAVSELMQTPSSIEALAMLGYPAYLNYIIGIAKILGVIAIVQTKYKTIKEWAYAGFAIDIIGAGMSFLFVGWGISSLIMLVPFLVVMFTSYFLGKKLNYI